MGPSRALSSYAHFVLNLFSPSLPQAVHAASCESDEGMASFEEEDVGGIGVDGGNGGSANQTAAATNKTRHQETTYVLCS